MRGYSPRHIQQGRLYGEIIIPLCFMMPVYWTCVPVEPSSPALDFFKAIGLGLLKVWRWLLRLPFFWVKWIYSGAQMPIKK